MKNSNNNNSNNINNDNIIQNIEQLGYGIFLENAPKKDLLLGKFIMRDMALKALKKGQTIEQYMPEYKKEFKIKMIKFEKRLARSKSCCYYNRMNTMTALQQQGQSRLQQSLQVMRLRG